MHKGHQGRGTEIAWLEGVPSFLLLNLEKKKLSSAKKKKGKEKKRRDCNNRHSPVLHAGSVQRKIILPVAILRTFSAGSPHVKPYYSISGQFLDNFLAQSVMCRHETTWLEMTHVLALGKKGITLKTQYWVFRLQWLYWFKSGSFLWLWLVLIPVQVKEVTHTATTADENDEPNITHHCGFRRHTSLQ